jgi:hypothetical protein
LFVFCFLLSSFGQKDYHKVDVLVRKYPKSFVNPEQLAKKIALDFTSEFEKVRAIYTWITNNIAYSYSEQYIFRATYYDDDELKTKQEAFDTQIAKFAITKGKAVCDGYATLFNKLCQLLDIKCKVVTGYSKTLIPDIGKPFVSNHAWNMIEINKKKYLIDATWGAGTYNTSFEKDVSYEYFFTKPELFFYKHYPDNYEDSLLKVKVSKTTYINYPIYYFRKKVAAKLLYPKRGILRKKSTPTKFSLKVKGDINHIVYLLNDEFIRVNDYNIKDGILNFSIDIKFNKMSKKLILFINNNAFVGYKIR